MTTVKYLPKLLSRLRNYGEGDQLKREAMQEIEVVLRDLNMSRRQFIREGDNLGLNIATVTSLGNWISCKHWPRPDNVEILLEALEAILRDQGRLWLPEEKLREASALRDQELDRFRQAVQDAEQAVLDLKDTITWINLSEFPPSDTSLSSLFIPLTRQNGIQLLNIILGVHNQELETKTFPRNIPHSLIVSMSSITLSHFLIEIGQPPKAMEVADEGTYILEDILKRKPRMREGEAIGEPGRTWAEIELLGYLRRGNSLMNMAGQMRQSSERSKLFDKASTSFETALEKVETLPQKRERWKPGILRDMARLLIQRGGKDSSYEDAEKLARLASEEFQHMAFPDDPLLYYVCQTTLARALTLQGKLAEASAAFEQAGQAEDYAQKGKLVVPGPLHRSLFLRAKALYYLERARSEGRNSSERKQFEEQWRQMIIMGIKLAKSAGLKDQEQQIQKGLFRVDREFRRLIPYEV